VDKQSYTQSQHNEVIGMKALYVKQNLRRMGFVFTDLGNGVRITARGPQSPSTEGRAGERDTIVKAQREGDVISSKSCTNHAVAAKTYIKYVEKYSE